MIVKHRSESVMQAKSEFAEGLQIFREPSTVTLMPLDKTFGLAFEVLAIKPVTLRAVGDDEIVGQGKELTFTGRALIVPTPEGFWVHGPDFCGQPADLSAVVEQVRSEVAEQVRSEIDQGLANLMVEGASVESSEPDPVNNTADQKGPEETPDKVKGSEGDAKK